MIEDIAEEVTQLMPVTIVDENATVRVAIPMPAVSPAMLHGYDMALARVLAQLLGITAEELVKRTQEASR